ncbi:MAG TPA: T9SS type A sorting domain-containing protein [Ignavibacteriaceae bacterium]|nr:T9SS type A sorting domain-containing protein [Ignavibacteriaceae bacterium]
MNSNKIIKGKSFMDHFYKIISLNIIAALSILLTMPVYSQNTQISWYSFSTGFGETGSANTSLKSIIGDPLVGTSSNEGSSISSGFFSNPASTGILTGIKDKTPEPIPTTFQLNQNYPNPFNPSTNIKFSVPEQSTVRIIIYDLLGRRVKTLLDEARPAGNYVVQWNGDNEFNDKVSSGIYFYSFYAIGADKNEYKSIKKMILLK